MVASKLVDSLPLANIRCMDIFLFIFVLISPIITFILSVLLLPEPIESGINLKSYVYNNTKWFFYACRTTSFTRLRWHEHKGMGTLGVSRPDLRHHNRTAFYPIYHGFANQKRTISRGICYILPGLYINFYFYQSTNSRVVIMLVAWRMPVQLTAGATYAGRTTRQFPCRTSRSTAVIMILTAISE